MRSEPTLQLVWPWTVCHLDALLTTGTERVHCSIVPHPVIGKISALNIELISVEKHQGYCKYVYTATVNKNRRRNPLPEMRVSMFKLPDFPFYITRCFLHLEGVSLS